MLTGITTTGFKKEATSGDNGLVTGVQKVAFAHKATAGATGINLSALTAPSEMTSAGFSNPSSTVLLGGNLLFYPRNLSLVSSLRGVLIYKLSFDIASSSQITFLGFTALEGEIFLGVIDSSAQIGISLASVAAPPSTGTLAAGATDFTVGTPFKTNQYSTTQVGAVLVYLDGFLQARNSNNSSVVQDGNYYEVDAGNGYASIIRFNAAHPTSARNVMVLTNGVLTERPDGSMLAVIENIQGQVNNMAPYVAAATGQSTTTVLGATATNQDLKAFGDRVVALESRATVDENPTLQSDIIATRLGQKAYYHGTSYNGGIAPTVTSAQAGFTLVGSAGNTRGIVFYPYQTQDGTWRMRIFGMFDITSNNGSFNIAVNGVLFGQTPMNYNSLTAQNIGSGQITYCFASGGTNQIAISMATACNNITFSGDAPLASKPTWAY